MAVDKIKCEICDEEFEPKKYSITRTCSKQCQIRLGVLTRKKNDSYSHDAFSKEKIRIAVNKSNAPLLRDHIPIDKYRSANSAKLIYDEKDELIFKDCPYSAERLLASP